MPGGGSDVTAATQARERLIASPGSATFPCHRGADISASVSLNNCSDAFQLNVAEEFSSVRQSKEMSASVLIIPPVSFKQ